MARTIETELALSVYRKMQATFIRDYLDDIPKEAAGEDVSITTRRNIQQAITPQSKDSAVLAVLRMRIFEEYRTAIGDNNLFVMLPDNFQAKLHQFPPQLMVGLGEVTEKGVTRVKWSFGLPHYRHKNSTPKPKIPKLHKGNYWARLILSDNSRIYINAISEAEGVAFITAIADLIDPIFLPASPLPIDTGKRGGEPIREVKTEPVAAAYYSKPKKNDKGKIDLRIKPDWVIDL